MTFETGTGHANLMDGVYRRQRHFYDLTRKYYLFGRDTLIRELDPPEGSRVLEIGCGTGRNLVIAANRYPHALFYGLDISHEMLKSADAKIAVSRSRERIFTSHGDARAFDTQDMFGVGRFDRIFMSYSASMIPGWERSVSCALNHLKEGGTLHIVDFGAMDYWPAPARKAMSKWLSKFHVKPCREMMISLHRIAAANCLAFEARRMMGGYAVLARLSSRIESPAIGK